MINHETELKLQAYLDSELSAASQKAIADLLGRDAGARRCIRIEGLPKSLLAENELERKAPGFARVIMSKIRRQIER